MCRCRAGTRLPRPGRPGVGRAPTHTGRHPSTPTSCGRCGGRSCHSSHPSSRRGASGVAQSACRGTARRMGSAHSRFCVRACVVKRGGGRDLHGSETGGFRHQGPCLRHCGYSNPLSCMAPRFLSPQSICDAAVWDSGERAGDGADQLWRRGGGALSQGHSQRGHGWQELVRACGPGLWNPHCLLLAP